MFQQTIQPFRILRVCSAPPFPDSGILCISHIFLVHIIKNILFLPAWHTTVVMCLHKCRSVCKDVSLILQINEAHYPWKVPKENRRDLQMANSFCEQDTGNNKYSGYWERFRCHEDFSALIFLTLLGFFFLSSFLSSSNKRKKNMEKKESNCLEIFVHMWYRFLFSLHCIPHCEKQWWGLVCSLCFFEPSVQFQKKFSFVYKFYLFNLTEQSLILL